MSRRFSILDSCLEALLAGMLACGGYTIAQAIRNAFFPASFADQDLGPRVAAFHEPYNKFVREFLGCPTGAREVEECDPKQGSINYGEFQKARKAAKALFDLSEPSK